MEYAREDIYPRDTPAKVDVPYRLAWRKVTMAEKKMVETHAKKSLDKMSRAEAQMACVWIYESRKQNPKPDYFSFENWTQGELDDYFADDPMTERLLKEELNSESPGKG